MTARDKNTLGDTVPYLPAFRDLRKSSEELLGSTVTTDHRTMQRLLPVSWTDTSCSGIRLAQPRGTEYDRTAPGPRSLLQGVLSMGEDFRNQKTDAGGDDKLNSVCMSRSLAQKRTFTPVKSSKNVIIFTCCH